MKNKIITSFSLILVSIVFSCKTADKVVGIDNPKAEAVEETPIMEQIKEEEIPNNFEIKMDKKVPVQSISIDTTKVSGPNMARPR